MEVDGAVAGAAANMVVAKICWRRIAVCPSLVALVIQMVGIHLEPQYGDALLN